MVIVGFSLPRSTRLGAAFSDNAEISHAEAHAPKRLFEYPDSKGEAVEIAAQNINSYLVDAPDIVVIY
jgi:hypothetical protein